MQPDPNTPQTNTPQSGAPQTIDEYIAGYPPNVQEILQRVRSTIRAEAPDATEAIGYGIPTFKLHGNLVHFAAFKKHIGFYPGANGIEAFQAQFAGYASAKGSVQFPLDQPIPYDLIAEVVRYRVQDNLARAAAKGKKKTAK